MTDKENAAYPRPAGHPDELILLIAERANRLAQQRALPPGAELVLWREAEAEIKRELHR